MHMHARVRCVLHAGGRAGGRVGGWVGSVQFLVSVPGPADPPEGGAHHGIVPWNAQIASKCSDLLMPGNRSVACLAL